MYCICSVQPYRRSCTTLSTFGLLRTCRIHAAQRATARYTTPLTYSPPPSWWAASSSSSLPAHVCSMFCAAPSVSMLAQCVIAYVTLLRMTSRDEYLYPRDVCGGGGGGGGAGGALVISFREGGGVEGVNDGRHTWTDDASKYQSKYQIPSHPDACSTCLGSSSWKKHVWEMGSTMSSFRRRQSITMNLGEGGHCGGIRFDVIHGCSVIYQ